MKHTVKAFVHYRSNDFGKPEFAIFPFDMSGTVTGGVLVGKQEVEVDVPDDFNPIAAQVGALKKAREQIVEQSTRDLKALDDQIANLLCLTNEVAA